MNAFDIKLFALIFMVIDHVGFFLFPNLQVLRAIGRLSFPLFAWLIANGANYTNNLNRYLARLALFALISQIPYSLAHFSVIAVYSKLNIFFTLSLGLLSIYLHKKLGPLYLWPFITIAISILAEILNVEYGAAGVLSIVAFYYFYNDRVRMVLSQVIIFGIPAAYEIVKQLLNVQYFPDTGMIVQSLAVLAVPLILVYNKKEGLKLKLFFYLFYPVHLMAFYLLIKYFN